MVLRSYIKSVKEWTLSKDEYVSKGGSILPMMLSLGNLIFRTSFSLTTIQAPYNHIKRQYSVTLWTTDIINRDQLHWTSRAITKQMKAFSHQIKNRDGCKVQQLCFRQVLNKKEWDKNQEVEIRIITHRTIHWIMYHNRLRYRWPHLSPIHWWRLYHIRAVYLAARITIPDNHIIRHKTREEMKSNKKKEFNLMKQLLISKQRLQAMVSVPTAVDWLFSCVNYHC